MINYSLSNTYDVGTSEARRFHELGRSETLRPEGTQNQIVQGAQHSAIGGGIGNTIAGSCSVVAGGQGNVVTGAFSAILGGTGNNDGGLANTMIVGSGINAVVPGALHVNGLWANGIPGPFVAPPILPPGTVWYGPPGIVGANALYII